MTLAGIELSTGECLPDIILESLKMSTKIAFSSVTDEVQAFLNAVEVEREEMVANNTPKWTAKKHRTLGANQKRVEALETAASLEIAEAFEQARISREELATAQSDWKMEKAELVDRLKTVDHACFAAECIAKRSKAAHQEELRDMTTAKEAAEAKASKLEKELLEMCAKLEAEKMANLRLQEEVSLKCQATRHVQVSPKAYCMPKSRTPHFLGKEGDNDIENVKRCPGSQSISRECTPLSPIVNKTAMNMAGKVPLGQRTPLGCKESVKGLKVPAAISSQASVAIPSMTRDVGAPEMAEVSLSSGVADVLPESALVAPRKVGVMKGERSQLRVSAGTGARERTLTKATTTSGTQRLGVRTRWVSNVC
ncbi:unnamed protein product [Choristocarpus tenellus]